MVFYKLYDWIDLSKLNYDTLSINKKQNKIHTKKPEKINRKI